ncbi:MAG: RNA polymerase sigma factor [Pseudobdellovibrionaceae bacterium]
MDGTAMDIDSFIERNEKAIFRFCLSLCGRRELAEEIKQETFIKVMANYALLSVQSEGQCLAWTFTTAKNLAFDFLRARKREEKFIQNTQQYESEPSPAQADRLEKFLVKLNPATQEAILLKYEFGMNSREIAEKLSVPEGTVRRRIQLGLAKLKKDLED